MKEVQKVFPIEESINILLWQKDGRVLWTQIEKHGHGSVWNEVFRVVEICWIYQIRDGKNTKVPKWVVFILLR